MTVDVRSDPSALLRVVGEPVRWQIVERLAAEELCVCHLVDDLGLAQPLVSHHLRVLREAGLVAAERYRQWTYYRLRPDVLATVVDRVAALSEEAATAAGRRRPCC